MAAWGERAKNELTAERLETVASLDVLARSEGHSVLELAFAWLLARPSVASVIAGATKPEQIAANVAAGQWQASAALLAEADRIAPR
jgi:aryl-alcohol dehydrogenase-like predicted oxidoreductase